MIDLALLGVWILDHRDEVGEVVVSIVNDVVGARVDEALCVYGREVVGKFRGLPQNHDITKAFRLAYLQALGRVLKDYQQSLPRESKDDSFSKSLVRPDIFLERAIQYITTERQQLHERLSGLEIDPRVFPVLDAAFADPQSGADATARVRTLRYDAESAVLEELKEHLSGVAIPSAPDFTDFASHLRGESPNQLGWCELFIRYLSEEIKTNERVERILTQMQLGGIKETARVIKENVAALRAEVAALSEQVARGNAESTAKLDSLVLRFSQTSLAREARQANVELRAFTVLARRINAEVDDENQALNELTGAVEELLKIKAAAAQGTHLDTLLAATLQRFADLSARGKFEVAANEAATAYGEWEHDEAARRASASQSGLTLIEANIQQQLLRRDAVTAATWIDRRLAHEREGQAVTAELLFVEIERWYDRGRERGLNLDLAVAIELARGALVRSVPDERGTALHWLGTALMSLGGREAGTARLEEAVAAYRAALQEYTQARVPLDWAMTQNNLGAALMSLGEREAGTARLEDAVAAYCAALQELTEENSSYYWKGTKENLAIAEQLLKEKKPLK